MLLGLVLSGKFSFDLQDVCVGLIEAVDDVGLAQSVVLFEHVFGFLKIIGKYYLASRHKTILLIIRQSSNARLPSPAFPHLLPLSDYMSTKDFRFSRKGKEEDYQREYRRGLGNPNDNRSSS